MRKKDPKITEGIRKYVTKAHSNGVKGVTAQEIADSIGCAQETIVARFRGYKLLPECEVKPPIIYKRFICTEILEKINDI